MSDVTDNIVTTAVNALEVAISTNNLSQELKRLVYSGVTSALNAKLAQLPSSLLAVDGSDASENLIAAGWNVTEIYEFYADDGSIQTVSRLRAP
jgi:hypothetical protein